MIPLINSEVTHGNFALEKALRDLVARVANVLAPGNIYYVIPTSHASYQYIHRALDIQYDDGSTSVKNTIADAVSAVQANRGDIVAVFPGGYNETITASKAGMFFLGLGGRGAAYIQTTTVGAEGMNVTANDVSLINLGIEAENTADYALNVFGARFRAYGCKFEGPTADVVRVGPDTVANGAASGVRTGADALFRDCEFCWGGTGIEIVSSDYGPCTELFLDGCRFHDNTVAHIGENDAGVVGAGKGVLIVDPLFQVGSDGSAPTDWIDLNSSGSTGLIVRPVFEGATLDSATVQLATGVRIVSWATEQEGSPATGGTNGRPD